MKRYRFYIPALLWTGVILLMCLMPSYDVPATPLFNIPYFDKMVHAGIFAVFVFLWCYGLWRSGRRQMLVYLAGTILAAVLLGLVIECLQKMLVSLHRDFEWLDWLADSAGAFFGGAVFREYAGRSKAAAGRAGHS